MTVRGMTSDLLDLVLNMEVDERVKELSETHLVDARMIAHSGEATEIKLYIRSHPDWDFYWTVEGSESIFFLVGDGRIFEVYGGPGFPALSAKLLKQKDEGKQP